MNKVKLIISIFICGIIISCSLQLYMPASDDAAIQQQLLSGRKLYVDHCGGCHYLHLPNEYSADVWQEQLDEMQVKAKISEEEEKLIFQFLTSEPKMNVLPKLTR